MTAPDLNLPRIWDGLEYIDGPPTPGSSTPGNVSQQDLTDALLSLAGIYAKLPDSSGQCIYVSAGTSGRDSNDGLTPGAPKATYDAAVTALGGLPGTIVLGAGIYRSAGLAIPAAGSRVVGAGSGKPGSTLPGTTLTLTLAGGTLLASPSAVTFEHLGFGFDTGVSSGTLIDLENKFNNHFNDVFIRGGWASTAHDTNIGQVGIKLAANAGDNAFHDFLISELGIGADIYSQTNNFSMGKFANCATHTRGGDATGVANSAGAAFTHVTWSGAGDYYVNLEGSSQSWAFGTGCWWDGHATTAVQVGNSNGGPALVSFHGIPNLDGITNGLKIDRCGMAVLAGMRFGSVATNPLTIDPTNAVYGVAMGLRSNVVFQFADSVFPATWTYIARNHLMLPSSVTGSPAFASLNTASLTNTGSLTVNRHQPPTTYTVLATDYYLPFATGTAAQSCTLISAAAVSAGHVLIIKDRSGGAATRNITITPDGTDTIDGASSYVISAAYGYVTMISNGTSNWEIVGKSA